MAEAIYALGSVPPNGLTVTRTSRLTIEVPRETASVTVDFPRPDPADRDLSTAWRKTHTVTTVPEPYFWYYTGRPVPFTSTQINVLPVLVLTDLDVVVMYQGTTWDHQTMSRPGVLRLNIATTTLEIGLKDVSSTTMATVSATSQAVVPTPATCTEWFKCMPLGGQIGVVAGISACGILLIALLVGILFWMRNQSKAKSAIKTELEVELEPKPLLPTLIDVNGNRMPTRRRIMGPKDEQLSDEICISPSTEDEMEKGLLTGYKRSGSHMLAHAASIPAPPSPAVLGPDRSPNDLDNSFNGRLRGLIGLGSETAGEPSTPARAISRETTKQRKRSKSSARTPYGGSTTPANRSRKSSVHTPQSNQVPVFSKTPTRTPIRTPDQAYTSLGHPLPLTPGEVQERKLKKLAVQKAIKLDEAQQAYHEGHMSRRSGENRRRERSADYDRRGDRLRKESPEAKKLDRIGTLRATSGKLYEQRLSSNSIFNLASEAIEDVDFDSPGNAEKLSRTLMADTQGIKAQEKEKNRVGSRSKSAPAVPRKSSRRSRKGVVNYPEPDDNDDNDDNVSTRSEDEREESTSPYQRRSASMPPGSPNKYRANKLSSTRSAISLKRKSSGKDKHRKKGKELGKDGDREFGRYGTRSGRDSPGSADVGTPGNPFGELTVKKKRSKIVRSLLPYAIPFALNAVNVLAEPEGEWNAIKKREPSVERSESQERAEQARRRELRRSQRMESFEPPRPRGRVITECGHPVVAPVIDGLVMEEVEKLDNTIEAFLARHRDGARRRRQSREQREMNEQQESEDAFENSGPITRRRRSGSHGPPTSYWRNSGNPLQYGRRASGDFGHRETRRTSNERGRRRPGGSPTPDQRRESAGFTAQQGGGVEADSRLQRRRHGKGGYYPPRVTRHLDSEAPKSPRGKERHASPSPRRSGSVLRKHVRIVDEPRKGGFGGDGADDAEGGGEAEGNGEAVPQRYKSLGGKSTGGDTIDTMNDTVTEQAWEEMMKEDALWRKMNQVD